MKYLETISQSYYLNPHLRVTYSRDVYRESDIKCHVESTDIGLSDYIIMILQTILKTRPLLSLTS